MGLLDPVKQAARVTSTLYYAANLLDGTGTASWQPRSTTPLAFKIPHAADGVVDLGLTLHHTLKASSVGVQLTASLVAYIDLGEAGIPNVKSGQTIWTATIPGDARYIFCAERGTSETGTSTQKVVEIPELRQPVQGYVLNLTPLTAPDEGDIYLRVIRRY